MVISSPTSPQDYSVVDAHIPHLPLLEHLVLLGTLACMPPEPDAQVMVLTLNLKKY